MDVIEYIREMFSRDCAIDTVLSLVMKEYGLSEQEAQKKIDEYFEIINAIDKERNERK